MKISILDVTTADSERRSKCAATSGLTVYYDGSCPLCSAEIGYYTSQVGGEMLRLVDVSANDADLGNDLANDTAMKRFHVRAFGGNLISGAAAFVAVWDVLPGWKRIARIARLPGIRSLLEVGYGMFLKFRPTISATCVTIFGKRIDQPNP